MTNYEMMKNSGIDWIGDIPEHWNLIKTKFLFKIVKRIVGELGYTVLSVTQKGIKPKDMKSNGQFSLDYSKYQLVDPGDFIMNHMDLLTGWVDISMFNGVTSPDYRVFKMISEGDPEYFKYIFQICYSNKIYYGLGQGVAGFGRWRLPAEMFLNFVLPVPLVKEQKAIASYLNSACTDIDTAIAEAKASIEDYKLLKQSIITKAVTKGLNPNVPMKDSGIEWIGEIPEHWDVVPFKRKISSIVDYRGKTPEKVDKGVFLVTAKNIKDGKINYSLSEEFVKHEEYEEIMRRGKPEIGDLLFTTEAPLGEVANVDRTDIALAQRVIKFQTTKDLDPFYLKFWMMSYGFQQFLKSLSTGSTASGIKASKLFMLRTVLPPIIEQKAIFDYLQRKLLEIDGLITEKEAMIADLEAYKKSLIFEVVTGKRKVC